MSCHNQDWLTVQLKQSGSKREAALIHDELKFFLRSKPVLWTRAQNTPSLPAAKFKTLFDSYLSHFNCKCKSVKS